jgi:hypothetical protein
MPKIEEELKDKKQSIDRIFQIAKSFYSDLKTAYILNSGNTVALSQLSFSDFYNFVRSIPYKRDNEPIEIVSRPRLIFDNYLSGIGRDCKKAAVLIGAYCELKKIPWRLVTISTRPDKKIHHVFPQVDFAKDGEYINTDATYSSMKIGESKMVSKVEYFEPDTFDIIRE